MNLSTFVIKKVALDMMSCPLDESAGDHGQLSRGALHVVQCDWSIAFRDVIRVTLFLPKSR